MQTYVYAVTHAQLKVRCEGIHCGGTDNFLPMSRKLRPSCGLYVHIGKSCLESYLNNTFKNH